MQLNTRNFFLYLLCVAFLLVAITATSVSRSGNQSGSIAAALELMKIVPPTDYRAEITKEKTLDREAKLQAMREKVNLAGVSETVIQAAASVVNDVSKEKVPSSPSVFGVKKCPEYQEYAGIWNPGKVNFNVVEGARLMLPVLGDTASLATSTLSPVALLQLPLRAYPSATQSCLATDIVGVALDGSLIRNFEVNLYGIFSAETLIGYSLDGFPLYGKNNQLELDSCGGIMEEGQYRYYLQTNREVILNCFAANPIKL